MQKLYLFVCMAVCIIFGSCSFTKWDTYEDLVGEWESPYEFCKGSKFIFNEDGTCQVIDVPIRDKDPDPFGDIYYTLALNGSKKFKEKLPQQEKWNFSGYWAVREDTFHCFSLPYYRYWILMSPRQEMLVTKHKRDSIINSDNSEDVYYAAIEAWTESFFPPACLHYLYFFVGDPDNDFTFHKKKNK